MGFWDFLRLRKRVEGEIEVKNARIINDIQISVSTGLADTREIKISAWNQPMAEELFWKVWDGLVERERAG